MCDENPKSNYDPYIELPGSSDQVLFSIIQQYFLNSTTPFSSLTETDKGPKNANMKHTHSLAFQE